MLVPKNITFASKLKHQYVLLRLLSTPVPKPVVSEGNNASNQNFLLTLRKSTGYPVIKCQQALKKFNNDLEKAKMWLDEAAKKENWDKANKLQHRQTSHGLIGTLISNHGNCGIMLELNCETDFVTRNIKFGHLMENILKAINSQIHINVTNLGQKIHHITFENNSLTNLEKIALNIDAIKDLPLQHTQANDTSDSNLSSSHKHVKDALTQAIGSFGENIAIKRGLAIMFERNKDKIGKNDSYFIGSYCHSIGPAIHLPLNPSSPDCAISTQEVDSVSYGKYGALVALRCNLKETDDKPHPKKLKDIAKQLAQHVVGMNPSLIDGPTPSITNSTKTEESNELPIHTQEDSPIRPDELAKPDSNVEDMDCAVKTESEPVPADKSQEEEVYYDDEFTPEFYEQYNANIKREQAQATENRFLKQTFLADPALTVEQLIQENGIEILDFARFECGEQVAVNQHSFDLNATQTSPENS